MLRWDYFCELRAHASQISGEFIEFNAELRLLDQESRSALSGVSLGYQLVKVFFSHGLVLNGLVAFCLLTLLHFIASAFLFTDVRFHLRSFFCDFQLSSFH